MVTEFIKFQRAYVETPLSLRMAELQFASNLQFASHGRIFIILYRNKVGRVFDAAIMYIRARLYPGISKYVLQKRLSYSSSIGSSLFVLLGR